MNHQGRLGMTHILVSVLMAISDQRTSYNQERLPLCGCLFLDSNGPPDHSHSLGPELGLVIV